MRGFHLISLLLVLLTSVAAAEDFDGSAPMECTALKGHDCLADKNQCSRLKPEGRQEARARRRRRQQAG